MSKRRYPIWEACSRLHIPWKEARDFASWMLPRYMLNEWSVWYDRYLKDRDFQDLKGTEREALDVGIQSEPGPGIELPSFMEDDDNLTREARVDAD